MKLAWCSCNNPKDHPYQIGWMALASHRPDVLLLLGDNVYLEDGAHELVGAWRPALHLGDEEFARRLHERYAMQFAVPEFQVAVQSAGRVAGTIDDHDFLGNDFHVTPATQAKARIARVLHRQFIACCNERPARANYPPMPDWRGDADGGFDQGVGLASSIELDDVRIILLDARSYRTPPGEAGSALGQSQLNWLSQELVGSQSVTIVACGSTLTAGTRQGIPGSPLDAYPREARVLRSLYRAQPHQTLIHLGGDLHYNELWPQDAAHEGFHEVASSGMGTGWIPFWPLTNCNFGLIEVEPRQVRVRTFGREAARNFVREIPRVERRTRGALRVRSDAAQRPDSATFQAGDLIWPSGDDQLVVYRGDDLVADDQRWRARRDAFVSGVAADPDAPEHLRRLAARVANWTYEDFLSFPPEARLMEAQLQRVWVGHVGIVELRDGVPWIVDAMPRRGVARQPYADWLEARPKAHVWHGRVRSLEAGQGAAIVEQATTVLGRPYNFFNFDLADTQGFYCSKLVWYAVWRALGLSLDGEGPNRRFWYSPWQVMRSRRLELLYSPAGYGNPERPGRV